jgi:hypothetical protein
MSGKRLRPAEDCLGAPFPMEQKGDNKEDSKEQ